MILNNILLGACIVLCVLTVYFTIIQIRLEKKNNEDLQKNVIVELTKVPTFNLEAGEILVLNIRADMTKDELEKFTVKYRRVYPALSARTLIFACPGGVDFAKIGVAKDGKLELAK